MYMLPVCVGPQVVVASDKGVLSVWNVQSCKERCEELVWCLMDVRQHLLIDGCVPV